MMAILDAILDFVKAPEGFSRYLGYYSAHIYGAVLKSQLVSYFKHTTNFLNDGHFERHLGFLGKLQGDSPGLLVCCSAHISGATLKISACSVLFQAYDYGFLFK